MTVEELVYDVIEIKNALEDDRDLDELWIINKCHNYRAAFINQEYALKAEIKPVWIQRLHKQRTTKVTSADDTAITISSIMLSKVTIPTVVSLPDDQGLVRVSGSSGISQFDIIDFNTLIMKVDIEEESNNQYGNCARIGNDLYLSPLTTEIQALIIAENPFDVEINDNGTLRDMLVTDRYPMERDMAQKVILEILTKDLALNEKSIADLINDSQSQLKILTSGSNTQKES